MHYSGLTQRRIADFVSELDALGIITARVISKGRQGRTREIQTSLSDDLISVLYQDELFAELAHYKLKRQTLLNL